MPLNNYEFGAGVGLMDRARTLGAASPVSVDEGSGIVIPGDLDDFAGISVSPVSDFFPGARNGKFTFIYGASQHLTGGPCSVQFLRQENASGFSLNVYPGVGYWYMSLSSSQNILTIPVPTPVTSDGMVFSIEWSINGGQLTSLSENPLNPSLPFINFVFKANLDSSDPDDGVMVHAMSFDWAAVAAANGLDPDAILRLDQILNILGVGFYRAIRDRAQFTFPGVFPNEGELIVDPFVIARVNAHASIYTRLSFWLDLFSLNLGTPGWTTDPALESGILEPASPENWTISNGVVGWLTESLGQTEIVILVIEETWEHGIELTPTTILSGTWEISESSSPVIVRTETWES